MLGQKDLYLLNHCPGSPELAFWIISLTQNYSISFVNFTEETEQYVKSRVKFWLAPKFHGPATSKLTMPGRFPF